jgi:hypothetical protein
MESKDNQDGLNYITPDMPSPRPVPPSAPTPAVEPTPVQPAVPMPSPQPYVPPAVPPVIQTTPTHVPSGTIVQHFTEEPKKSWFNKKIFYAIWIIALVVAGGFLLYTNVFASPEKVLGRMQAKFLEAKSFSYKGEMSIEASEDINMVMSLSGFADFQSQDSEKSVTKFVVKNDKETFFDAESRILGKDVYFKVNDLAPMILAFVPDRMLEDWYHVNSEEVQKELGLEKTEDKEQMDFSEKEMKELYQSLRKNKVLNITEVLKSEKIDGENTHHYKYTINKEGLKAFYKEAYAILGYEEMDQKAVDEELDDTPDLGGEIWVGKRTSYLRKVTINAEEEDQKFTFSLSLFDYNKAVSIEKPENAVEFMDVFDGISEGDVSETSTCGFDFAEGFEGTGVYKNTTDLILEPGSSTKVSVTGNQISWRSNNRTVAEADSIQGNTVNIKANKKGKAQFVISAAGAKCDLKVYVTVADNQDFDFSGSFGSEEDTSYGDDNKRLADIRQLSTALELYYNDQGGYPAQMSLAPMYISSIPNAPEPPGTNCTSQQNKYEYKASGAPYQGNSGEVYPSYTMTFCLGDYAGGYPPGNRTASPQGIQ